MKIALKPVETVKNRIVVRVKLWKTLKSERIFVIDKRGESVEYSFPTDKQTVKQWVLPALLLEAP
jgi:cytochrome c-type biogenesis protein CcmH/NrfF